MKRYTGETAWRHAKFIGQRYDRHVSPYAGSDALSLRPMVRGNLAQYEQRNQGDAGSGL